MKAPLVILAFLIATAASAQPSPQPRERPRVSARIKMEFQEKEHASAAQDTPRRERAKETVELDPLEVRARGLVPGYDRESEALKSLPFTWKDGGTYYRHVGDSVTTEWKFQWSPVNKGFRLLDFWF